MSAQGGRPTPSSATPSPLAEPQKPEKTQGDSQAAAPSVHPPLAAPTGAGSPPTALASATARSRPTAPGAHSAITDTRSAGPGDTLTAQSPCNRKGHYLTSVLSHRGQPFRATCHHLALPAGSAPGCVAKAQAEQKPHPPLPTHTPRHLLPQRAALPCAPVPGSFWSWQGCARDSASQDQNRRPSPRTPSKARFLFLAPPSPGECKHRQQVS